MSDTEQPDRTPAVIWISSDGNYRLVVSAWDNSEEGDPIQIHSAVESKNGRDAMGVQVWKPANHSYVMERLVVDFIADRRAMLPGWAQEMVPAPIVAGPLCPTEAPPPAGFEAIKGAALALSPAEKLKIAMELIESTHANEYAEAAIILYGDGMAEVLASMGATVDERPSSGGDGKMIYRTYRLHVGAEAAGTSITASRFVRAPQPDVEPAPVEPVPDDDNVF